MKEVYNPEKDREQAQTQAKKDKEFEKTTPKEEKPIILEGQVKERVKAKKEKKPKEPKQAVEPKSAIFPIEAKVNKYGFIYLDGDVLAAWGLSKGVEQRITIDLQGDALIARKV